MSITNITANIIILNPDFQDFIQFFILLLTVSAIVLVYDSVVFPYWMDKTIKDFYMAPTRGFYVLCSTLTIGLCLVGSCISILILFNSISDFMLILVSAFSEILWVLLTAAIILMLICFILSEFLLTYYTSFADKMKNPAASHRVSSR